MAQNLVKFPIDLGENDEHHHFMVFRIYSNSSASLSGSTKTLTSPSSIPSDSANGEGAILAQLDRSRGQEPMYNQTAPPDNSNQAAFDAYAAGEAADRAEAKRKAAATSWYIPFEDDEEGYYESLREERAEAAEAAGFGAESMGAQLGAAFVKDTTYARAKLVNQDAIYLPFPQTINMTDGWNWETVSFQKSGMGEAMAGNLGSGFEKGFQSAVGTVGKVAGENVDKLMAHSQRRVANPRKEAMFQEPNMRTFSFEFDLAPRNAKESESAQAIIQLFKYHASPELYDNKNAQYNYPSEFQMYFMSNGVENNYIGKIDRCALQSCAVSYTNANMWSAFRDTGAPTHMKITLEFTELSLQSRNSLMKMDGIEPSDTPDVAEVRKDVQEAVDSAITGVQNLLTGGQQQGRIIRSDGPTPTAKGYNILAHPEAFHPDSVHAARTWTEYGKKTGDAEMARGDFDVTI